MCLCNRVPMDSEVDLPTIRWTCQSKIYEEPKAQNHSHSSWVSHAPEYLCMCACSIHMHVCVHVCMFVRLGRMSHFVKWFIRILNSWMTYFLSFIVLSLLVFKQWSCLQSRKKSDLLTKMQGTSWWWWWHRHQERTLPRPSLAFLSCLCLTGEFSTTFYLWPPEVGSITQKVGVEEKTPNGTYLEDLRRALL